jgi:hypothetical protein
LKPDLLAEELLMRKQFTPALLAAGFLLAAASPAMAAPFCSGSGVTFSFGFRIGEEMTEREKANLAMIQLRREGVDTDRVEFWNGCLRAFVQQPGGGETMEYYDPHTFERVY